MAKKRTKKEWARYLEENSKDGKVSLSVLAEMIYDVDFPQDLFPNANIKITEARDTFKRHKEIGEQIVSLTEEAFEITKKLIEWSKNETEYLAGIIELRKRRKEIEDKLKPLEKEFDELQEKIRAFQSDD